MEELAWAEQEAKILMEQEIWRAKKLRVKLSPDAQQFYKIYWAGKQGEEAEAQEIENQKKKELSFSSSSEEGGGTLTDKAKGDVRVFYSLMPHNNRRKKMFQFHRDDMIGSPYGIRDAMWLNDERLKVEPGRTGAWLMRLKRAVENINAQSQPFYDLYDPEVMRQAHFNSTLVQLKPLLVAQVADR